tara:strand:+ start:405 stop:1001 length:597 start_codon:yes stop_codon:yes gene_type:complete
MGANLFYMESLPSNGDNSPSSDADTQAALMLVDSGATTPHVSTCGSMNTGTPTETVVLNEWDGLANGLPSDAVIKGIKVGLDMAGTITGGSIRISLDAGSAYGTAVPLVITGLEKNTINYLPTPADSSTDELFNRVWDASSIDWDDVWVAIDVSTGGSGKSVSIDCVRLGVYYTVDEFPSMAINSGILTVNGGVVNVR